MILMDFAIFMVNIPTVKEYRKLNLSEEQGERFHQDIKTMEVRYLGAVCVMCLMSL
jgi:hypothetical protein